LDLGPPTSDLGRPKWTPDPRTAGERSTDRGAALLAVLMALTLLSALGAGRVFSSAIDVRLAANDRDRFEAFHAADAILARTIGELAGQADWDAVLAGAVTSSFADGAPAGSRTLRDGSSVDLSRLANEATCGRAAACTDAERRAVTADRPWGANNPEWRLFAYGPSSRLVDEAAGTRGWSLVVLVADDQSEQDGDPARDAPAGQPGAGMLVLRAMACGPNGTRQTIDATILRVSATADDGSGIAGQPGVRLLSWRWAV
jgi:hypothetical protein